MIRVLCEVPSPRPDRIHVRGERFHHLAHVVRVKPGTEVEVFDGAGRAFDATVAAVTSESVELVLGEERAAAPQRQVVLAQALPKGDKLEWIIEKAVELGAAAIVAVTSARAVVKLDGERARQRLARWRRIAEEAARQCGRRDVPRIDGPVPLDGLMSSLGSGAVMLLLDEEERTRPLGAALDAVPPESPLAILVGPEGGFDRAEVASLVQAGAIRVTLGANVLRTETAGLAALAIVRHRDGHLG